MEMEPAGVGRKAGSWELQVGNWGSGMGMGIRHSGLGTRDSGLGTRDPEGRLAFLLHAYNQICQISFLFSRRRIACFGCLFGRFVLFRRFGGSPLAFI